MRSRVNSQCFILHRHRHLSYGVRLSSYRPGGEGTSLEFTPTWVVAAICTVIARISLAVESLLHYTGKKLKVGQKPLFEASCFYFFICFLDLLSEVSVYL